MSETDAHSPPETCASCGGDIAGLSREDRCPNCGVKIAHLGEMPPPAPPPIAAPMANADALEGELDPPNCPRCQYGRAGLARGSPCPECGKVPGVPDHFPAYQPIKQARLIEHAIGCSNCGYNLRGLMSDGTCPECGSAIGPSLRPAYLRLSPPESLQQLERALMILTWAAPISWGMMSLGGLYFAVLSGVGRGTAEDVSRAVLVLGSVSVFAWGAWRLAEPDVHGRSERGSRKGTLGHSQHRRRVLTRVAACFAPLAAFVWLVVSSLTLGMPLLMELVRGLVWLAFAGLTTATLAMAHVLAYRADNPELTKSARNAEATGTVLLVLETLTFGLLIGSALLSGGPGAGACVSPMRLFALIVVIQAVLVFARLRAQVRRYAGQATRGDLV